MRNKALVLAAALAAFSSAVPEVQAAGGPGHSPPASPGGSPWGRSPRPRHGRSRSTDDGYEYGPPEYYRVYRRRFVMREYEPPFEPLGFHDDWDD